jgi:hypothetical protein
MDNRYYFLYLNKDLFDLLDSILNLNYFLPLNFNNNFISHLNYFLYFNFNYLLLFNRNTLYGLFNYQSLFNY